MRSAAMLRLALAGRRSDGLRIGLTAVSAALGTLALLAAATVLSVTGGARTGSGVVVGEQGVPLEGIADYPGYTSAFLNEPGLRPGVAVALVLLTIPVLFLAGQCSRVGALARDRRLAAVRMAGGTPGQAGLLVAVETGVTAALGALLGLGTFLVGRALLDAPAADGRRPLPTDVLPPWPVLVAVVAAIPVLVPAFGAIALRRVLLTPFGVVRRARTDGPRPWGAQLVVAALGGLALVRGALTGLDATTEERQKLVEALFLPTLFVLVLLLAVGLLTGTAALAHLAGRFLAARTGSPALLIAARRLETDPWATSRALSAVALGATFGAGAAMVRAYFSTYESASREAQRRFDAAQGRVTTDLPSTGDDIYLRAMDLIDLAVLVGIGIAAAGLLVGVAEGIVERRRSLAALTASGTPRRTLGLAVVLQVLVPTVPLVLAAVASGAAGGSGWLERVVTVNYGGATSCVVQPGDPADSCQDPAYFERYGVQEPSFEVVQVVGFPWGQLALVLAVTLGATLLATALSLLLLPRSTDVAELRTG